MSWNEHASKITIIFKSGASTFTEFVIVDDDDDKNDMPGLIERVKDINRKARQVFGLS